MTRRTAGSTSRARARAGAVVVAAAVLAVVSPVGLARADTSPSPSPDTVSPSASPSVDSPTGTSSTSTTGSPAPATSTTTAPAAPTPTTSTASPTPMHLKTYPNGSLLPSASLSMAASATFVSPHGPYDMQTDACASCHRAHTAQSTPLLVDAAPQSRLCLTCHDGSGSSLDVSAQYTDPKVLANDPSTASYWQHDVSKVTNHTLAAGDEFSGVLNRHTECGDCHNPHEGTVTDSTSSPTGTAWTLSGRNSGISGVAVTNGGNGAPSTYTWLNGTSSRVTSEYQLCMKCHSGYTNLLPKDPAHPSRDMLDAAVEFNPANFSFHPVEAPGTNTTPKMAASLSGPSAYKLWNLTPESTVRCTNCHASPAVVGSGSAQGADAPSHASPYRGILIAQYEDRVLTAASDTVFNESRFALCFLCHSDTPFTSGDTTRTNFSLHQKHMAGIGNEGNYGAGRDIDVAGDGQGLALCAECHFRPHSTATTADQNARLVTFAPDVEPILGKVEWRSTGTGSGSCTLKCHGFEHVNETYAS